MATRRLRVVAGAAVVVIAVLSTAASTSLLDPANRAAEVAAAGAGPVAHVSLASDEEALAERFAPVMYLRHGTSCVSGVPYVPAAVDFLFGNDGVTLGEPGTAAVPSPAAADLEGRGPESFLDFPGNPLRPGCRFEQDFRTFGEGQPALAYTHITGEPGHDGLALQYWFFYYFNDWNNRHEGDWEMIQLDFAESTAAEALRSIPRRVIYSQHADAERADWDDGKVRKEGDHPVVYPSIGSHASYFRPAIYLGKGENGSGFGCDDARGPHTRVPLSVVLLPHDGQPTSDLPWVGFEGRWGERLRSFNNGPTGPWLKTRWNEPLTWAESVERTANLTVPSGSTLGLSATGTFCGVVGKVSPVALRIIQPGPIGLLVLIPFAGIGVSASAWMYRDLRAARRRPAARPVPLARRRGFGEILLAGAQVYRAHWRTWLAIASVLVPGSFLLSVGWSAFLWLVTPADTFVDLADDRRMTLILGLFFGVGADIPMLLLVTSGVIAAMHALNQGTRFGWWPAARTLFRHARELVVSRLAATAWVALLALTQIGLPWAVKRTVQWYFIEQAVITRDAGAWEAMGLSSAVVRGSWWRTAGIVSVLGAVGWLLPPILGTVLIVTTSLPLWEIDVACSLAYVVLMPYVAICLMLAYWDLEFRSGIEMDRIEASPAAERDALPVPAPGASEE